MERERERERKRKTTSIGGVTGLIVAVLLRWVSGMGMERERERNRKEERRKIEKEWRVAVAEKWERKM